jgi:uncharacterized protein (DUF2336 family)
MATTRAALTDADLRTLVKGATPDERALAAQKLCRTMDTAVLTPDERVQAHEILRVMAADAARAVRKALAVTLKSSPLVPRDVALRFAGDLDEIALPILNYSPAFTDEDLVQIIRTAGATQQVAVAKRPRLTERVTGVIADVGLPEAVQAACGNDNAAFSARALTKVMERFEQSESILAAIAYRQVLPLAVSAKLIALVGDQVREHLVNHHAVSLETAMGIATGATERAVVDLIDDAAKAKDLKAFVRHLHLEGQLTASLLLRGLANGNMAFFEWGVSELSGVPHHRTWLMIHDAGPLGLRAIYERAGLPSRLYSAFRVGIDTFHSMDYDGRARDRERFQERMLQRFLTQTHQIGRDDLDYLIDKLDRISSENHQAIAS